MAKGIFITGTDTGVGKTIVGSSLAMLLKMKGVDAGVMKPVTSGCRDDGDSLVSDDALLLCRSAGLSCSGDIAPYLLREPVAPAEAAKLEGVRIDFARIRSSFDTLTFSHDYMIVEGAGGLMVPLAGGLLVADLVKELDLRLLVVARPGLGTINHTVLTCFSARQMGLDVAGVIINRYPDNPGAAERSAPHHIGSLCGAPVLGLWPVFERGNDMETVRCLADWLNRQPETGIVLRELGWG